MDARGLLYITGRESDMYISGGSNVYPREVEEVLLTHPAVAEVAIVGMPDPKWGEIGIAILVPREGATPDEPALRTRLADQLARYKHPHVVLTTSPRALCEYDVIEGRAYLTQL